ncbi:MAG: DUF2079 domain-containing protein [Candidatus Eremiobacteraeota bacterium]|nr:DUF2079 domain-containing protein [Candidatus Eremiobacteraeota bacterium]
MRASSGESFPAWFGGAIAAVAVLMAALAAIRWSVWTYGTDTGTFAQIAQNAFRGFTDGPEGGSHFAFHWSPILALLWPVVALTHSPLALQFVQVILIVLTSLTVYAIVLPYAGAQWGARCGLLALIYPPLLSIAFEEFHELAFYPVLLLALVWAADRARWGWFAVAALAAVLVREDVCIDLIVFGIALFAVGLLARDSDQRGLLAGSPIEQERLTVAGAGLAVLAAVSLACYSYIVVPRIGHWAPSHFYTYTFAHGPVQAVLAIFFHPVAVVSAIATVGRLTYLLEAFAPLAFLPLFTRWTLLALPGLAGVLLASDSIVWRMGFHYSLLWAPWLLLSASWVLCKLHARGRELGAHRWWLAAIAVCVAVLAFFNPMHPAHYLRPPAAIAANDVERAFTCVPKNAPVMTHDEWFAHVASAYPQSRNLDETAAEFRGYLVIDPSWPNAHVRGAILPEIEAARAAGRLQTICRYGAVTVLKPTSAAE